MDPFTDMLDAIGKNLITRSDLLLWLKEWAEQGAPAHLLCRPLEYATPQCDRAVDLAYAIAYGQQYLAPCLALLTSGAC